jgi:hypothetical protein
VVYSQGQLEVTADDSSLNQVLREIARQSGMKITGGVADQRVYGKYGPGRAGDVLASLLDGTDSNMMLRETAANAPAELILTPQEGGPTPPNPNAQVYDDRPAASDQAVRPSRPDFSREPPFGRPSSPAGTLPAAWPGTPGTESGAGGGAAGDEPASPNGVKTPQQLYEELQQMRHVPPPPQ